MIAFYIYIERESSWSSVSGYLNNSIKNTFMKLISDVNVISLKIKLPTLIFHNNYKSLYNSSYQKKKKFNL